ncbi:MAG: hypothetical protein OXJ52_03835 [Oligoflexia bacterium]|nr:hypothetical protein [Oligoflexia bacterium]
MEFQRTVIPAKACPRGNTGAGIQLKPEFSNRICINSSAGPTAFKFMQTMILYFEF